MIKKVMQSEGNKENYRRSLKEESKGMNSESSFSQESSDNSPVSGQIDQN